MIKKITFWRAPNRYGKENNLRTDFLKFKLRICRKPGVLLSSFDSDVLCDIIYHYTCYRLIKLYQQARN